MGCTRKARFGLAVGALNHFDSDLNHTFILLGSNPTEYNIIKISISTFSLFLENILSLKAYHADRCQ